MFGLGALLNNPLVQFVSKEIADWARRRDELKRADLEVSLAERKAKAEMAA